MVVETLAFKDFRSAMEAESIISADRPARVVLMKVGHLIATGQFGADQVTSPLQSSPARIEQGVCATDPRRSGWQFRRARRQRGVDQRQKGCGIDGGCGSPQQAARGRRHQGWRGRPVQRPEAFCQCRYRRHSIAPSARRSLLRPSPASPARVRPAASASWRMRTKNTPRWSLLQLQAGCDSHCRATAGRFDRDATRAT